MIPSFDLTLPTLEENLALDEALLIEAEEGNGGEWLRLWEWPTLAVVLGAGGEVEKETSRQRCLEEAIPIQRRSSGGGTVLLGRGCLLFSLILSQARAPELKQVNSSYQWILNRLAQALAPLGEMQHEGICDLTWTGRKFSGNAQQRKQRFLLHHGTLLYDFPLTKISHYLKPPEREPEYRRQRSHDEFVANLSTNGETLRTFLLQEWQGVPTEKELPRERVQLLMDAKYGQTEWVFRR